MRHTKTEGALAPSGVGILTIGSPETPFALATREAASRDAAPANNVYGLCSIQDYSGSLGDHGSDLSNTHADALGFYDYLSNFSAQNFWFRDGGVKTWQYEEPYDHWQSLYGVDAVLVFYHSGHGNMTASGVFEAPTGGTWSGETWISSDHDMLLANQVSRYVFWSTCLSCRVSDGITPITTWAADDNDPGFRMLFGFETTSVDSGDYGKNFWSHWVNGESFSTAWLNASWDIDHAQSPSCVASGSDATDAANRLYNERFFYWDAVSRNWYQWRWYVTADRAARNKSLPRNLAVADLRKDTFTADHVHHIANELRIATAPTVGKDGRYGIRAAEKSVSLDEHGRLDATLGTINHRNTTLLDPKKALDLAEKAIQRHQLHAGEAYQFDVLRLGKTAGSRFGKEAKVENEYVSDTTVQFRQLVNGVPVVNTDAGLIRVTIDNDGNVTHLHSSVKKVARLHERPRSMAIDPLNEKTLAQPHDEVATEDAFRSQLARYQSARLVSGGHEVGYDIGGGYGRIVAQRIYEVTMANGLKKRLKILVPLFE